MKKQLKKPLFLLEGTFYALLLILLVAGKINGLANNIPHPAPVFSIILSLTIITLILASRNKISLLMNLRSVALLFLLVTAAAHLTVPAEGIKEYPYSPLCLFYYVLIIIFASLGSLKYWTIIFLMYLVSESASMVVGLFFDIFPKVPAAVSSETVVSAIKMITPHFGYAFTAGIIAYSAASARIRQFNKKPHSHTAVIPADTAVEQAKNKLQTADAMTRVISEGKTGKFSIDYISEIQAPNTNNIDDLLSSVVYFMSRNFKAYSALGFIFSPERQSFVLNSFHSRSVSIIPGVEIPLGNGIIGKIGSEKHSFLSGDLTYYNEELSYYNKNELINSILALPIISDKNELLGTLVLDSKDKNAFSEQHKETLRRFSSLAAALIINVRMRIYQEEAAKHFRIFYEASQKFTTALNIDHVLDILFHMVGQIAQYSRLMAVTFDSASSLCSIRKLGGNAEELKEGMQFPINDGLYSMVYLNKKPINIGDFQQYQGRYYRFIPNEPANPNIHSLVIIPLANDQSNCRCTISLENSSINQYQGEIEQILSILAGNAAVAFDRALLYQKMEMLATTDGLTGLNNHRYFQDHLLKETERANRYSRPLSLLLMDIDHFKSFNDTYGHPVGDLVLKEISICIRKSLRINDFPARYGGEEFTVILPETDEKNSYITAERIRQAVESHKISTEGKLLSVTVSIGCATLPQNMKTHEKLVDCADKALYYSKEHGRNQVTIYKKGM